MIYKKSKLGEAARGVATTLSTHRVVYRVANGARLRAIVASVVSNNTSMNNAEGNGQARILAYVGEPTPDGAVFTFGNPDVQGRLIADVHVGMSLYSGAPIVVPLSWELNAGESVTIEVTYAVNNVGGSFDANVSANLIGEEYNGQLHTQV